MNLRGLHCIRGKGIHKHCVIERYRLHTCHDHHRNTWKGCLGVVFCADTEACQVVNNGLISPQISSFPRNQLLSGFVWILPLVNIYISRWIQSLIRIVGHLLGCQRCMLAFILLLHQQKVKLVSENGRHTPILLHILHKYSERLICNLPSCFEAFNDVIASSRHLTTCLVIEANLLHLFRSCWSSRF
jgi:hypothetical protein